MSVELKVPSLGESIREAQIERWLKKEGDFVKRDEPVVSLESDKANVEVPAPVGGILKQVLKTAGSKVAIGEVLARIEPAGDLVAADLMIEAVVEDPAVKEAVFRRADELFAPEAILASNTSSIPISSLAAVTGRPDRVVGMHFFNPVPLMALVEVVRGLDTSDETTAAIVELAQELGKTPAEARDLPGFVSNRILMPFINEAAYAMLEGVADPESIDTIAKLGFNHPIGPLALADLIGLDTCVAIMEVLHAGLGNPKYAPCPLLRQYVQAGRLGRKSGRGFYTYA